jgi:diguanylate cyclase (GGDEF)-like protein/putative nucleotidyltransferase with HDIG domain
MLDQIVGLLDETTRQRDALASAEELKRLHEELQAQHEALNKANERLAALATTDPLTGLPNHRAVMNRIEEELARARRTEQLFALLFLDVDHFKRINDTWGHRAGDAVLCEVGRRLKQGTRVEDFAGRYGGEEFAIVLTNTDNVKDARKVAERLRESLADAPCVWENEENNTSVSIPVTASFGVAVLREHATMGEALLEAADSAMYEAKHNGRNRVCVAGEEMEVVQQLVGGQQGNDGIALRALAAVANAHDRETGAHARRVVLLAEETARELGCTTEEQYLIRLAALLHDIGKVGVPDEILRKPGPLTEDEWIVMRRHPKIGHQILAQAGGKFELLSHIVVAHHERWDGKGYPYGLSMEAIPLGARILAVVDSFDAMTSDRPYRNALSEQEAQAELQRCAGSQYDSRVVNAFCKTLDSEGWKEAATPPALSQAALRQES